LAARGQSIETVRTDRRWTVLSLLEWGDAYLRERGFDEARLHTELLIGRVLGLTRLQVYLQYDRPLDDQELASFKALFKRRLVHEPLQYILGETEFMGLPFMVDRRVLIPRQETEILVEIAAKDLQEAGPEPNVLEVGTGAGNIAVALGRLVPTARILSIDVSEEALEVAAENIARNDVTNVVVRQGDIRVEPLEPGAFDMLVSNPPYVSLKEFETLQPEVRDYEPPLATTDGSDGFSLISRIMEVASTALRAGGWLLMEIGFGQGPAVLRLAADRGLNGGELIPDYAGIPRVFRVRRSG
jgi:release factor glutamine methyltransferase